MRNQLFLFVEIDSEFGFNQVRSSLNFLDRFESILNFNF